jgi:hypothetical protein
LRPDEGVLGSKLAFARWEISNGCQVPAGVAGVAVEECKDWMDGGCDKSFIRNRDLTEVSMSICYRIQITNKPHSPTISTWRHQYYVKA